MATQTATQKAQEVVNQLNSALLLKEQLIEQLELTEERVKALRNVLAGIEVGRNMAAEQTQPVTDGQID